MKKEFDFDTLDWESLRPKGGRFANEKQDEFVYHTLAKHSEKPGFFLDVGCAHPKDGSNTYVLEKYFNWSGIGFDVGNVEKDCNWSKHRETKFCRVDVTEEDFTDLLGELVGDQVVDYISLDVDWDNTIYAHRALDRILDAGIKFKVMTLEHESYKHHDLVTKPTRKSLGDLGYTILFENVSHISGDAFEDWWVNPKLIPEIDVEKIRGTNLSFNDCIHALKEYNVKD